MAANDLQTSASVGFNERADTGRRLVMETDNDPALVKQKGTSYIKVYPSSADPKVTAVLGNVTQVATKIPEDIIDYVSFTGASSSALRYLPDGIVKILERNFFGSDPAVAYDKDSNSIALDVKAAHGIVKIQYRTYFNRYLVSHGDSPCGAASRQTQSIESSDGLNGSTLNYDPAFLVATATGWDTVSMDVSGPPCSQSQNGYSQTQAYSDYRPVGLKVEVDSLTPAALYPFYFSANSVSVGFTLEPQVITVGDVDINLFAGCRVRVYPRSAGVTLYGVNCAVSSQVTGAGSKPVLQSRQFSGTQSVNLDYPPSGRVAITSVSANALSLYNENVSVAFLGPGDWVNEVIWTSRNSFVLSQGARKVRDDEVVAVTSLGSNTIPCYTFVQVQYTSDYELYDVLFTWDNRINWYGPAMVLAIASDGRMGTLELEPPSKRGVL